MSDDKRSLVGLDPSADLADLELLLSELAEVPDAPSWIERVRSHNVSLIRKYRIQAAMGATCPACGGPYTDRGPSGQCLSCGHITDAHSDWLCTAIRVDGKRCQRARMSGHYRQEETCAQHVHAPRRTLEAWHDLCYPGWQDAADETGGNGHA